MSLATMALALTEQLFMIAFAVAVGVAGGALLWRPRAIAGGGDPAETVFDDHLGEPWTTRSLRGLALVAIGLAALLIHFAAAT